MAHPSRWVLIGLSVRLGTSIYEIETWELPVIRQYMAYLMKPSDRPEKQQTPEEIAATFRALCSPNK